MIRELLTRSALRLLPLAFIFMLPHAAGGQSQINYCEQSPAVKEDLKEVEKIASNPAKPTFDNTIVEMERSGRLLERSTRIFSSTGRATAQMSIAGSSWRPTPSMLSSVFCSRINCGCSVSS